MANIIHAREVDGELRYRMWNDTSDEYVTEEMTEEELHEWLREEAIQDALANFARELPGRLERANTKGTSSMIAEAADLTSGWVLTREEQLAALDGPGAEVARACLADVGFEHSQDLAAMPEDEAVGYAFTLLLEIGIDDPEEYLQQAGVLE